MRQQTLLVIPASAPHPGTRPATPVRRIESGADGSGTDLRAGGASANAFTIQAD